MHSIKHDGLGRADFLLGGVQFVGMSARQVRACTQYGRHGDGSQVGIDNSYLQPLQYAQRCSLYSSRPGYQPSRVVGGLLHSLGPLALHVTQFINHDSCTWAPASAQGSRAPRQRRSARDRILLARKISRTKQALFIQHLGGI